MKDLLKFDKDIGADGGHAHAGLSVEGDALKVDVSFSYPIAKVIEPATKAVDGLLDKVKALIPGSWDDVLIDKFKEEYKADLVKLLAE